MQSNDRDFTYHPGGDLLSPPVIIHHFIHMMEQFSCLTAAQGNACVLADHASTDCVHALDQYLCLTAA